MEFRGKRRRRTGMSYYMAAGLCIAAVCMAVLSAMINKRNANIKPENELTDWVSEDNSGQNDDSSYAGLGLPGYIIDDTGTVQQDVKVDEPETEPEPLRQQPEEIKQTVQEENTASEPEDIPEVIAVDAPVAATAKLTLPVTGNIIKPYSGVELVFCSTFGDWRVHEGTDLAADPGSEVHAAASGVVLDFVEDPLYGYSVVVNQDDDSFMYYCGLSSTCMVSAGVKVNAGDVIGYVGEVPCEAGDGSHIHLAMMNDGKFVDPGKYFP